MKLKRFALPAIVLSLYSCTWVDLTKGGDEVTLVKSVNVNGCRKVGTTTTFVKHEIGFITRDEETVREELVTLARNKAAEMGGDSIVAKGEPVEGRMSFDIFKCSEP